MPKLNFSVAKSALSFLGGFFLGVGAFAGLVALFVWLVIITVEPSDGVPSPVPSHMDHVHEFDQNLWRKTDSNNPNAIPPHRWCMVESLTSNKALHGLLYEDVVMLLGSPTMRGPMKNGVETRVDYFLRPEQGMFGIDGEYLSLWFSAEGRVNRVAVSTL